MVDGDVRYDIHCPVCNYVQLHDQDISVPDEVYRQHYESETRKATGVVCSFLCKLELFLDSLESEEDFNRGLEVLAAREKK